jgi:hypothetical protein
MANIFIGIDRVQFHHGGRFDTGFWTTASILAFTKDSTKPIELSNDEAEDLDYVILKWLKKRLKVNIEL